MKKLFILLATGLCLIQGAAARPAAGGASLPAPQEQTQKPAAQSADLVEADRLSAEVVKLYRAGKYDDALPLAKQALKLREKELGSDHQLVAAALGNLAGLMMAKGDYKESESIYRRALGINEKTFGATDPRTGKTLERLAAVETAKGDYDKAQEYSERAYEIQEKALGAEHPQVLQALDNLAAFYMFRGKYGKAAPLYERAATIREKKLGATNPLLGATLEHWACALYKNKQTSEADKIELRANDILYKADAAKAEPVQLGYSAFNCRIMSIPQPRSPVAAMRGTQEVVSTATVLVDENGKVTSVQFTGGGAIFNRALEDAIVQARFRPLLVDGRPVKVSGEVKYRFGGPGNQDFLPTSYGATR